MLELYVIETPTAAAVALDSIKARILAELREPASAASIASRIGLTRQKVNYHLRALEDHKLVEPAEQRRWGGLTDDCDGIIVRRLAGCLGRNWGRPGKQ